VIKTSSDKDLIANASIYRAQNYIDQNQNDKALSELKSLGEQYKNTAYAQKLFRLQNLSLRKMVMLQDMKTLQEISGKC
jgi:hypothetical protein